ATLLLVGLCTKQVDAAEGETPVAGRKRKNILPLIAHLQWGLIGRGQYRIAEIIGTSRPPLKAEPVRSNDVATWTAAILGGAHQVGEELGALEWSKGRQTIHRCALEDRPTELLESVRETVLAGGVARISILFETEFILVRERLGDGLQKLREEWTRSKRS
ncbi:hypothetical protein, partial [Nocardia salmonicida]